MPRLARLPLCLLLLLPTAHPVSAGPGDAPAGAVDATAGAADATALPAPLARRLKRAEAVMVGRIVDGQVLELADGRLVRLAGLRGPAAGDPLHDGAMTALAALAAGRAMRLLPTARHPDRHGHWRAHLVRADDGLWLNGALAAAGWVRVDPGSDPGDSASPALLVYEAGARSHRLGLWADPAYAVWQADGLDRVDGATLAGRFHLVEGRVRAVAEMQDRTYLNFGPNWRTDFTVELARGDLRRLRKAGLEPTALEGALVRVRGWVELRNGPAIRLTAAAQIEPLADPPDGKE